ncbi:MAG: UDP-glucose 4-epimerase GalE [Spirochaetes bacterium]|uniref:UDP-glucose 4-epimerase n=1 Tax=Candidatus Ornithospirochaeta stercoripullorum TaxID=2840899 RepID=A0A9D9E0W8_9SPIO|nr:UDP-glucose 4-epimerase GalE [Candidatus Ornithospirochaeta stercoripullorum]
MKVLLFGGAGYIGTHVAMAFMDRGDTVGIYDNLSTGLRSNVPEGAEFYEGDILDRARVSEVLSKGWDAAVHLAAFKAAGESMVKPEKYSENNITGSLIIMTECEQHGCMNFILSSSAATYGEPQYLPIDEKHPNKPENYYGYTKYCIEENLKWYSKLRGMHFAALRYFNAAGYDVDGRMLGLERNPANLIPVIMECAAGMRKDVHIFGTDYDTPDGTCIRDYVHVSDLADAHVAAADYLIKNKEDLIVNLGSETGLSVREIVETARKVTGQPIPSVDSPRRPGDPAKLVASSTLAHEKLGWSAKRSDAETLISSTWRVYQANMKK